MEARAEWSIERGRLNDRVSDLEGSLRDAEDRFQNAVNKLEDLGVQVDTKEEALQSLRFQLMDVSYRAG